MTMENEVVQKEVTLDEYKRMLAAFDWYYEDSDDHRVWKAGFEKQKMLWEMAKDRGIEFMNAYFEEGNKHPERRGI
jgi:hypothetical protein